MTHPSMRIISVDMRSMTIMSMASRSTDGVCFATSRVCTRDDNDVGRTGSSGGGGGSGHTSSMFADLIPNLLSNKQ